LIKQDLHDSQGLWARDLVVNILADATSRRQGLIAQDGELLGQGRLDDAEDFLQFAPALFPLRELAQQHQSVGVGEHLLSLEWILVTHAHAEHVSAAPYLKAQLGGQTAIGEHISDVQDAFNRSIPTMAVFSGGREVARQAGAMSAADLARWVSAALHQVRIEP